MIIFPGDSLPARGQQPQNSIELYMTIIHCKSRKLILEIVAWVLWHYQKVVTGTVFFCQTKLTLKSWAPLPGAFLTPRRSASANFTLGNNGRPCACKRVCFRICLEFVEPIFESETKGEKKLTFYTKKIKSQWIFPTIFLNNWGFPTAHGPFWCAATTFAAYQTVASNWWQVVVVRCPILGSPNP